MSSLVLLISCQLSLSSSSRPPFVSGYLYFCTSSFPSYSVAGCVASSWCPPLLVLLLLLFIHCLPALPILASATVPTLRLLIRTSGDLDSFTELNKWSMNKVTHLKTIFPNTPTNICGIFFAHLVTPILTLYSQSGVCTLQVYNVDRALNNRYIIYITVHLTFWPRLALVTIKVSFSS